MTLVNQRARRRYRFDLAAVTLVVLLTWLFAACTAEDQGAATATATAPAEPTATATSTETTPAVETSSATHSSEDPVAVGWPLTLGVPAIDAALDALRSGDGDALLALVSPAAAACTTAVGAGGPPRCPSGTLDGTVIEYISYFECDGWGAADAALDRLISSSSYPLVALAWDPPVAPLVGDAFAMTHAVVFARGSLGEPGPASDARLLTTLAFDGDVIREIVGDCGAYSEVAFRTGELPELAEGADVFWRGFPAAD